MRGKRGTAAQRRSARPRFAHASAGPGGALAARMLLVHILELLLPGECPRGRDDRRHGQAEALDSIDRVAAQPLRCLLGQRRDDDLVEAAVADGRLDGCDRIGAPDEAVDATLRLPRERVNRRSPQGRCARPGQAPVTRQHLVRRHRAARTLASAAPVAHARLKQARRSCTPKPRLRLRKSSEHRALP